MGWFGLGRRELRWPEDHLRVLAECGVRLAPGVDPEAFVTRERASPARREAGRRADQGFLDLLLKMGSENESASEAATAPWCSDDVWHFDTECIEATGSYVRIARRLETLAQGELPLQSVRDHVDVAEAAVAWLEFRLDGVAHRIDAVVNGDWVDRKVLSRFAELLAARSPVRRFTWLDLAGQDCLIGCATEEEFQRLRRETKLGFTWLK